MRTRAITLCFLLVLWSGALAAAGPARSPTDGTVRVGDMAPGFRLVAMDGTPFDLSERLGRGRPVLLVFWSYFCFPCQREMPLVAEMARELGDRVDVLGICLDGPRYDDRVLPFLRKNRITFPNAYDRRNRTFFEVAERYGVLGTPTFFLLDEHGRVRFIHLGRLPTSALRQVVEAAGDAAFCPDITPPPRP